MKKMLFALPVILLVAAGCNSSQPTSEYTPPANTTNQQTVPPTNAQNQPNQNSGNSVNTPPTDPTSDWKIYSNSTYSYQIKYPKDFTLKVTSAKDVAFQKNSNTLFTVMVSDNPAKSDAQGLKTEINNQEGEGYPYQESFVSVAGINSFKQARYDDGVQEFYFVPSGNNTFNLNFKLEVGTGSQPNKAQDTELISKILSTFKLTK